MITEKTYKALKVLLPTKDFAVVMSANNFAQRLWGNDPEKQYLFTAVTNGGNGACAGKKAWLCAGSYLSKLAKKRFVRYTTRHEGYHGSGYQITKQGLEAIKEYESCHTNQKR